MLNAKEARKETRKACKKEADTFFAELTEKALEKVAQTAAKGEYDCLVGRPEGYREFIDGDIKVTFETLGYTVKLRDTYFQLAWRKEEK